MDEICLFLIMFTGSVLPDLPKELDESDLSGLDNCHRGTRDRFAEALMNYRREFGSEGWTAAAEYFAESGELIEKIAEWFTRMILNRTYSDAAYCIPLFERAAGIGNKGVFTVPHPSLDVESRAELVTSF